MTGPRPVPDPAELVHWYEVALTILVAGIVGATAAWVLAKWRRLP